MRIRGLRSDMTFWEVIVGEDIGGIYLGDSGGVDLSLQGMKMAALEQS